MTLTLYKNFSKRENSTKRPDSAGTDFEIVLKQPTSIQNPTFVIAGVDTDYNYAYWNGRYYFINDISIDTNGLMTIRCSDDVLASWKDEINALSAMVLYDTTGNTNIIDGRLGVVNDVTYSTQVAHFRTDYESGRGSYIVIVNTETGVAYYKLNDSSELNNIIPEVDFESTGYNIVEFFTEVFNKLAVGGSVQDNIRDVFWIPFSVPLIGSTEFIPVGKYISGARGAKTHGELVVENTDITIPWQFNDWRNQPPYTEVYLYIPFIGNIQLPCSTLQGISTLNIRTSMSTSTGEIAVQVSAKQTDAFSSIILGSYSAQTGHKILIGGTSYSLNSVLNAIPAISNDVKNLNPLGVMATTISALMPIPTNAGGIGSDAGSRLEPVIWCYTVCHNTTCEPSSVSSVMGTPAFSVKTIGNLSGYIQCLNASFNGACTDSERTAINGYLNGGFFNE